MKQDVYMTLCQGKEESSQSSINRRITRKEWTREEDRKLKAFIGKLGTNWKQISEEMGDRNPSQCAQRWKRIKPESVNETIFQKQERSRKGWTKEEDEQLIQLIKEYDKNWSAISKVMHWRTGKQIRERFINQLNPEIKIGEWTQEEDLLILELFKKFGSKWTEISKQLAGRPVYIMTLIEQENSIKNRFYSFIRQAYMNIENPYYQLPKKDDEDKRQKKLSVDLVKEEEIQNVPCRPKREERISVKQRSLSHDSLNRASQISSELESYQRMQEQYALGTLSSSRGSKHSGKQSEQFQQPLFTQFCPEYPEINQGMFIEAYNQQMMQYSFGSDKKLNNIRGSISLQFSSGAGHQVPQVPPFQLYGHSIGMSEENNQSLGNEQKAFEAISYCDDRWQYIQNPFSQLFNANVIAVPVLVRNDIDLLGIQMENIRINEGKKAQQL